MLKDLRFKYDGKRNLAHILVICILILSSGCSLWPGGSGSLDESGTTENTAEFSAGYSYINTEFLDEKRAYETVVELSSEKYEGRLAGTMGNQMAAKYIASAFESAGLASPKGIDGYYQYFEHKNVLMVSGSEFVFVDDKGGSESGLIPHVDVRDMIRFPATLASGARRGEMVHITDLDQFTDYPEALGGKVLLINHEIFDSHNPQRLLSKVLTIDPKPAGVFIHLDNRNNDYYTVTKYLPENILQSEFDNEKGPGVFYVTSEGFTKCLQALRAGKDLQYAIDYSYETYKVPNVIGYLPATRDEPLGTVLFSAHFDHVGINGDGSYNPGALDNASGVAALLELARAAALTDGQRDYTLAFAAFNSEEEGLLGSFHYVDHPLFALDKTILVNFDMIGSARERALNIDVNSFAMGTTQDELYELSSSMNVYSRKDFSGGSDHVPFEVVGVDSVLLINADMTDIHTRMDSAENVDSGRLYEIIELVATWLNEYK